MGALADYAHALELDPLYLPAWQLRADLRRSRGDRAGAISDYERFLAVAPDAPEAKAVRASLEALRLER